MDEECRKKLIKDLGKTGFGSEMRVLKIFRELDWRVSAGKTYFDRDENKSRELDIYAHRDRHLNYENKRCVDNFFHICAEVKKSEKPWIVFRQPLDLISAFDA